MKRIIDISYKRLHLFMGSTFIGMFFLLLCLLAACSQETATQNEQLEAPMVKKNERIRFTFYEDLENTNLEIGDATKNAYEFVEDTTPYLVIVATFTNAKLSDQVVRNLIKQGVNAKSNERVNQNGIQLYRVESGPYPGKRKANAAQNTIESLGHAGTYLSLLN